MTEWIQNGTSRIDPLFITKLLIERNEGVYVRNLLALIKYAKACDKVKRHKLLDILQSKKYSKFIIKKCNRNLLWKQTKSKDKE
jgi:hypothetical protein